MLGNPFSRRRKAGGRARFTFGRDPLDTLDAQDAFSSAQANDRPAVFTPFASQSADAQPDKRRRDAETLAGGADRLSEIENFALSGSLPAADQKRLRDQRAKLDWALDKGPFDAAVAPLREMEKRYAQALGPKAKTPEQPDPFATTHLPYLNRDQQVADMKRPDYGLAGGAANPALHDAIRSKLRKSTLPGQRQIDPIEPPARIGSQTRSRIAPDDAYRLLPARVLPNPPRLEDVARTLEDRFRPDDQRDTRWLWDHFGLDANPLSDEEWARLVDHEVEPLADGVRVAQASPSVMTDATAGDLAGFGEALKTALDDLASEDAGRTPELLELKARVLRGLLKQDGLYDGAIDDAEAAAKAIRALSPAQREAFVERQVKRSAIAVARANGYGGALEKSAQETLQGAAAIFDGATAPRTEQQRGDPVWGLDDDLAADAFSAAATGVESLISGESVERIRQRKTRAGLGLSKAIETLPGQLVETIKALPDTPEAIGRWLDAFDARAAAFEETEQAFLAGDATQAEYLEAAREKAAADAEAALQALDAVTGAGSLVRGGLKRIAKDLTAEAKRLGETVRALGDDFDGFGGLAPAGAGRTGVPRMPEVERAAQTPGPKGAQSDPMSPAKVDGTGTATRSDPEFRASVDFSQPAPAFRQRVGQPPRRGPEFDIWFDGLSRNDLNRIFLDDPKMWKSIGDKIRGGGKYHEWFMVTMAPDLRGLGVPMSEIRGFGFRSPTKQLFIRDQKTGEQFSHFDSTTHGGEARDAFDKFHGEIQNAIWSAAKKNDIDQLFRSYGEIAKKWLPKGINDLPPDLQSRVRAVLEE